tara:strand:+ start:598 stop:828 length:231 start_codon:yes stop_codon:yes gene_type:complete
MYEKKKDKTTDSISKNEKSKFPVLNKFFKPNRVITPSVGMERRKDILAESYLLNFNILAAVIVIPDLLTPGTKENT